VRWEYPPSGLSPDRKRCTSRWISASVSKCLLELCRFKGSNGSRWGPAWAAGWMLTALQPLTRACSSEERHCCVSGVLHVCGRLLTSSSSLSHSIELPNGLTQGTMSFAVPPYWLTCQMQTRASNFQKHYMCGFSHKLIHCRWIKRPTENNYVILL
jgi:hypothetical protein